MKSWMIGLVILLATNPSDGWNHPWWDEGCEFACCSCCPKSICLCALESEKCRRPLWSDLPVIRTRQSLIAVVEYVILAGAFLALYLIIVGFFRDVPDLPRRSRAVNPIGHSEGSLCLLHAFQRPPPQAALVNPQLKLVKKPASLRNLVEPKTRLEWLAAMASDSPPTILPSPLDRPNDDRKSASSAPTSNHNDLIPSIEFLQSQLFLVARDWKDRCSVLCLSPKELDEAY